MSNTPRIRKDGKIINKTLIKRSRQWGEDRDSHHLIVHKVAPPSVDHLAQLMLKPENKDIFDYANKGRDFSECIGNIAAFLDIALDGEYDVPDLCELLCKAINARGTLGNSPHKLDDRLVNAEIIERDKTMELIQSALETGTIAPLPQADMMKFMEEHGCELCENVAACKAAKKCLGEGAFEAGVIDAN